jgi:8-oxo-dGTP pyrophosphatase MutT (NUDIX family)
MLSPERQSNSVHLAESEPVKIARAVLVAPIPVSDIQDRLNAGIPAKDISFSEVILIQKSTASLPSSGLVMPVGGEVAPGESVIKGALREVGEEITATSLAENLTKERWENEPDESFKFGIPGVRDKKERQINFFVLPVQSRSFSVHKPRESDSGPKSEDKISNVLHFSPQELKELIHNGIIKKDGKNRRIAGHFVIDDATIEISEIDREKRKSALNKVLEDVNNFELNLKSQTLLEINKVRRVKGENRVRDLSECMPDEVTRGFVGAQLHFALLDEKRNELKKGPHQLDSLLKALPYLASKLPAEELSNLLYSLPNREAKIVTNLLKEGFNKGAEVIISSFSSQDEVEFNKGYSCLEDKLREIWPDYLKLSLVERVNLLKKADEVLISEIISSDDKGIIEEDVNTALESTANSHDFITRELGELHQKLFQEHRPMNEISTASLFPKMLYAIGLHPHRKFNDQESDELRILRFEAVRFMAEFYTTLEAQRQIREADNSLFQAAIDTFFEFPPIKEYMDIGEERQQPVYHRVTEHPINGKKLHVLVDEREKKQLHSGRRKLMQSPVMNDIFSINFAFANDNFDGNGDPVLDRLKTSDNFRKHLINHVKQELAGSGWKVSIMKGTYTKKVLEKVEQFWKSDKETVLFEEKGGKRAGSRGDAIMREKFILCMENKEGKIQKVEICIYPFETNKSPDVDKLYKAGYWTFSRKIFDDYVGKYKAKRILERDTEHPTVPSLYERYFPRRFYPTLSDRMQKEHVKSRKSKLNGGKKK